jgi:hypothetical protein
MALSIHGVELNRFSRQTSSSFKNIGGLFDVAPCLDKITPVDISLVNDARFHQSKKRGTTAYKRWLRLDIESSADQIVECVDEVTMKDHYGNKFLNARVKSATSPVNQCWIFLLHNM